MIYLTSDTHFNCENLVRQTRGEFSCMDEHDLHLMDALNTTVDRRDRLVILGDFSKGRVPFFRNQIRCRHITFIMGNHDKLSQIQSSFSQVYYQRMIRIAKGSHIWCSHFPTAYWDRSHWGVPSVYGHIHDSLEREQAMDLAFPGRRSMDVGVDAAKRILGDYRPFSIDEVLGILMERPGHDAVNRRT